MSSLESKYSK